MNTVRTRVLGAGPLRRAKTGNKDACLDVERYRQDFPILREMPYGTAPGKASVMSFVMDGVHPHDIGTIPDRRVVANRARQDIDALVAGLVTVQVAFR